MEGAGAHAAKVGAVRKHAPRRNPAPANADPVPGAKAPRKGLKARSRYLDGISREPIVIKIPGNIAAAFRAGAKTRQADLMEEIFHGLCSLGSLALAESERDDVPGTYDEHEWLMDGAGVVLSVPVIRHLIRDALSLFRSEGIMRGETPREVLAEYRYQKRTGGIQAHATPVFDREAKVIEALDALVPNVDVSEVS